MKISSLMDLARLPIQIRPVIDYGSWRGDYTDAVVVFDRRADYVPISTLIPVLDKLSSGASFEVWKGGEFSFSTLSNVHFEYEKGSYNDLSLSELLSTSSIKILSEVLSPEELTYYIG